MKCQCSIMCDCDNDATTEDIASGTPLCDACADFEIDSEGNIICSLMKDGIAHASLTSSDTPHVTT